MSGFLARWIRDAQGRVHDRGESVVIVRQIARADFDSREMLIVRFADDSTGAVFSNEIEFSAMPDASAC